METSPDSKPTSRRERLRASARDEIKSLAQQQMAESGSASLQLNAIARAMGMVPSAIYRYYADRDALITALIVDAYDALAASLRADVAAAPTSPAARLLAAAICYRRWALAHPVDYQLIFGNPIPGYVGPPEQTGAAGKAVFGIFLSILEDAHTAGALRPPPHYSPDALAICPPENYFARFAPSVTYAGIGCWAKMHGMVELELVGHLQMSLIDVDRFYRAEMASAIELIGLARASSDRVE
jgi:AcrR family transcriptional regulator